MAPTDPVNPGVIVRHCGHTHNAIEGISGEGGAKTVLLRVPDSKAPVAIEEEGEEGEKGEEEEEGEEEENWEEEGEGRDSDYSPVVFTSVILHYHNNKFTL